MTTTWGITAVAALGVALSSGAQAETTARVQEGATVLMEYTITVPESHLIIPKNVSQFVPGHHDVLPNLEQASRA